MVNDLDAFCQSKPDPVAETTMTTDPRVDAYIAKAPDFARPMLEKIRAAFLKADKDIGETIKWGMPFYQKNGLVGGMAAFKAHVNIAFSRGKELSDPENLIQGGSMGGIRIDKDGKLPAQKTLIAYIKEAIALNGTAAPKRRPVKVPDMPEDFATALAKNARAKETFENFAPSHKRDYLEWILEARQAATRERRIAQAVEWLAEGKPRHWKHMKK